MSELKSYPMKPRQAAEKLQESYDYMTRVMPEDKRSRATIDILAAMSCAISVCRAQPDNAPLTCDGCTHHNSDVPWPEICFECKRQSRQDMYHSKPKGE